jgi:hypothetical protein
LREDFVAVQQRYGTAAQSSVYGQQLH